MMAEKLSRKPETKKRFGDLLRQQRKKFAYSQEALGKTLNVGISSIVNWETGVNFPTPGNLKTCVRVLDITPAMLKPVFKDEQEYWDNLMKDETFKLMMSRRQDTDEKPHYTAYERHAPFKPQPRLKPEDITPEQANAIFHPEAPQTKPEPKKSNILTLCKEIKILDMTGEACCYHINTGDGSVELRDCGDTISLVHGQLDHSTLRAMISELQEIDKILSQEDCT